MSALEVIKEVGGFALDVLKVSADVIKATGIGLDNQKIAFEETFTPSIYKPAIEKLEEKTKETVATETSKTPETKAPKKADATVVDKDTKDTKKTLESKEMVSDKAQKFIDNALSYIDMPYKRGGNGNNGIDCSGLVVESLKKSGGKESPREARLMFDAAKYTCRHPNISTGIHTQEEFDSIKQTTKAGDLVFWKKTQGVTKENKEVYHVGIVGSPPYNESGEIHIIQATRPKVKDTYESITKICNGSRKPHLYICQNVWNT